RVGGNDDRRFGLFLLAQHPHAEGALAVVAHDVLPAVAILVDVAIAAVCKLAPAHDKIAHEPVPSPQNRTTLCVLTRMYSTVPPPSFFTLAERSWLAPSTMTATGPAASAALTSASCRAFTFSGSSFTLPSGRTGLAAMSRCSSSSGNTSATSSM